MNFYHFIFCGNKGSYITSCFLQGFSIWCVPGFVLQYHNILLKLLGQAAFLSGHFWSQHLPYSPTDIFFHPPGPPGPSQQSWHQSPACLDTGRCLSPGAVPALGLVELLKFPIDPLHKLIQVLLDVIVPLQCASCTSPLGDIHKLVEGALAPNDCLSLVKTFNSSGPSISPQGTPLVTDVSEH